jgi:hypothetical protein
MVLPLCPSELVLSTCHTVCDGTAALLCSANASSCDTLLCSGQCRHVHALVPQVVLPQTFRCICQRISCVGVLLSLSCTSAGAASRCNRTAVDFAVLYVFPLGGVFSLP